MSEPSFETPEAGFQSLFDAYLRADLDDMIAAKDFETDAKCFWGDLGLPITEEQFKQAVKAFENNFRKQMTEEGIPDYQGVTYEITSSEQLQDDLVALSITLKVSRFKRLKFRIPMFKTSSGWKAVRVEGFDHL